METVLQYYDHSILTGYRDEEAQDEKYEKGLSKVQWPNSKHNSRPAAAVDAAPYPIRWPDEEIGKIVRRDPQLRAYIKDLARFYHFAGYVQGTAQEQGTTLRFGGDWDEDRDFLDNHFDDLPHLEIVED